MTIMQYSDTTYIYSTDRMLRATVERTWRGDYRVIQHGYRDAPVPTLADGVALVADRWSW